MEEKSGSGDKVKGGEDGNGLGGRKKRQVLGRKKD